MLKLADSVKALEQEGAAALERLLKRVPRIRLKSFRTETKNRGASFDLEIRLELDGQQHTLIVEIKANGQPRYAREAILQLKSYAARSNPSAIPVLIAPFLSPSTRELCTLEGVSYVDLEGNARLTSQDDRHRLPSLSAIRISKSGGLRRLILRVRARQTH